MDSRDYVRMRYEKRLRDGAERQKIGTFEKFTKVRRLKRAAKKHKDAEVYTAGRSLYFMLTIKMIVSSSREIPSCETCPRPSRLRV